MRLRPASGSPQHQPSGTSRCETDAGGLQAHAPAGQHPAPHSDGFPNTLHHTNCASPSHPIDTGGRVNRHNASVHKDNIRVDAEPSACPRRSWNRQLPGNTSTLPTMPRAVAESHSSTTSPVRRSPHTSSFFLATNLARKSRASPSCLPVSAVSSLLPSTAYVVSYASPSARIALARLHYTSTPARPTPTSGCDSRRISLGRWRRTQFAVCVSSDGLWRREAAAVPMSVSTGGVRRPSGVCLSVTCLCQEVGAGCPGDRRLAMLPQKKHPEGGCVAAPGDAYLIIGGTQTTSTAAPAAASRHSCSRRTFALGCSARGSKCPTEPLCSAHHRRLAKKNLNTA